MKNIFNVIKNYRPGRSLLDLTHDVKTTVDMGWLTPIMTMECIPGDKVNISAESLIRFQPLVAPVMHRFDVTIHYFFVPNRLVWPNWEKFITGNNGGITPQFPTLAWSNAFFPDQRLGGYLGLPRIPVGNAEQHIVSALPFAAYQLIYKEYYRDQNLVADFDPTLADGNNNGNATLLQTFRRRAWEHDYFTSCLPFAQKGAAVDIPLGNVVYDPTQFDVADFPRFVEGSTNVDSVLGSIEQNNTAGPIEGASSPGVFAAYDPKGTLAIPSTPVNNLRTAFSLQRWLEKQARGGSRYIETILEHFGVKSSDARLDRPEYVTGVKSPVVISEVLNNTGESGGLPQGNMAGHGVSVLGGKAGGYFCEEHGYMIGIMSVLPKTAYQQGIPKHFLKTVDPYDYYWPSFAHIGEQEVKNVELYAFNSAAPNDTFGYLPRYAEYKFLNNMVTGDMRDTLDFWHDGRIFATQPNLNQAFIECVPDKRIFAVTSPNVDSLVVHVLNKITASRLMPKYANPGGI